MTLSRTNEGVQMGYLLSGDLRTFIECLSLTHVPSSVAFGGVQIGQLYLVWRHLLFFLLLQLWKGLLTFHLHPAPPGDGLHPLALSPSPHALRTLQDLGVCQLG